MAEQSFTVKIEGIDSTSRAITAHGEKYRQEMAKVVQGTAKKIHSRALSTAPTSPANIPKGRSARPSGSLKQSIKMTSYFNGLGAMILPHREIAFYRHFIEYGTKQRQHKKVGNAVYKSKNTGQWTRNAKGNVGAVSKNSYMQSAKDAYISGYNAQLQAIVGKEIVIK